MSIHRSAVLLPALLLAACAPLAETAAPSSSAGGLPTGARLSPAGFLTIREAPPSPFPEHPPSPPAAGSALPGPAVAPRPPGRRQAWERVHGSAALNAEFQRLSFLLPREEPDNFVSLEPVLDPDFAAEVWFERDAAATLARYTSNPLFRPREGGISIADRRRLDELWRGRSDGGRLISLHGIDPTTGRVELHVAVEEAEFRRIATERGWELGPELELHFPVPRPPAFADPSLAPLVRMFAREHRAAAIRVAAGATGRIVLEDGCFRLATPRPDDEDPLVLFGRNTQLDRDAQGYLIVVGRNAERRYRIGELGSWGGDTVHEDEPDVRQLRLVCGQAPIVNVTEPESLRLAGLPSPQALADHARIRSLSYEEAWNEVITCMKRHEQPGRIGAATRERCIRGF